MTEESEVESRWAGYFERLYQTDPPAVELDVGVLLSLYGKQILPGHIWR